MGGKESMRREAERDGTGARASGARPLPRDPGPASRWEPYSGWTRSHFSPSRVTSERVNPGDSRKATGSKCNPSQGVFSHRA